MRYCKSLKNHKKRAAFVQVRRKGRVLLIPKKLTAKTKRLKILQAQLLPA